MYAIIGTDQAIEGYRDAEEAKAKDVDEETVFYRDHPGEQITIYSAPADWTLLEVFNDLTNALKMHLKEGAAPAWVESDEPALVNLVCAQYKMDAEKNVRPEGWGRETGADLIRTPADDAREAAEVAGTSKAPSARGAVAGAAGAASTFLGLMLAIPAIIGLQLALRTNAGRDFQAGVMSNTSSNGTGSYAPAVYIALTTTNITPAAGDTTLSGEIATGTLARAAAAYAHTSGTATYTLTKTFTSDSSVTVYAIGIFNAATAGTMVFETSLNATATLVSGDQLQVQETVSL